MFLTNSVCAEINGCSLCSRHVLCGGRCFSGEQRRVLTQVENVLGIYFYENSGNIFSIYRHPLSAVVSVQTLLLFFCNIQSSNHRMLPLFRYKSGRNKQWKKPATTTASSSTTVLLYDESNLDNAIQAPSAIAAGTPYLASQTPVLASNCPGWICYAEKTQPNALPYVSTVKSSQQILGAIFKRILFAKNSIAMDTASNSEVFLVSVQPCFDKKLEASRKVFVVLHRIL